MIYFYYIRSSSALKSPNKPAVPPKPKHINNKSTPSPKKSSHQLNSNASPTSKCNGNGDSSSEMQFKDRSKSSFTFEKNKKGKIATNDVGSEKGKFRKIKKITTIGLYIYMEM